MICCCVPPDETKQLTLINIDDEDFERTKQLTFDLYARYQTQVHNDPPVDMCEFNNFICKSPIKHETPYDGPKCGYGTFHQQYWLNDTLIAVGVMDIMPRGISSVYFFYDPDYSFLTLGTYGTLREIEFIQDMNKTCPQIRGYYIGMYIPTVPKMLYKGKLQPSYLLCPETHTYHLLNDDLLKVLEKSKYARFNADPRANVFNEFDPATDLNHLRLLVDNKQCLAYNDYKQYKNKCGNDEDKDTINLYEYGKAVGKSLSQRLYLVI